MARRFPFCCFTDVVVSDTKPVHAEKSATVESEMDNIHPSQLGRSDNDEANVTELVESKCFYRVRRTGQGDTWEPENWVDPVLVQAWNARRAASADIRNEAVQQSRLRHAPSSDGDMFGRGLLLMTKLTAIARQTNVKDVISSAVPIFRDLLSADRCNVFVLDPKSHALEGKLRERKLRTFQVTGGGTEQIVLSSSSSIVGACVREDLTLNIADAYADPRFDKTLDEKTGYRTRNVLCVPIRHPDKGVVGAVQVLNKVGASSFNEDDENLGSAFADAVAVAIYNVLLVDALNRYVPLCLSYCSLLSENAENEGHSEEEKSGIKKNEAEETEERSAVRDIAIHISFI